MSTEPERLAVQRALGNDSQFVVELGAHCGEDEFWIRPMLQPPAYYVMVEPDPRNVQIILDRGVQWYAQGVTPLNRRLIVGAVGATMPENVRSKEILRPFHMSENVRENNNGSGSLLKPTGHVELLPWITFPATTMVPCYTLDHIFNREWLRRIDLLWVDIQGAEREMIEGGMEALRHTRWCFIEVEDVELYEGEALKPELISRFHDMGWALEADFEFNVLLRNNAFEERGPR